MGMYGSNTLFAMNEIHQMSSLAVVAPVTAFAPYFYGFVRKFFIGLRPSENDMGQYQGGSRQKNIERAAIW